MKENVIMMIQSSKIFETCFLTYYTTRFYKCFMRTWEECEWVQVPLYMGSKSSLLIVFKSSIYLLIVVFLIYKLSKDLLILPVTMVGLSIFPCGSINFYTFKTILLGACIFNIIFLPGTKYFYQLRVIFSHF